MTNSNKPNIPKILFITGRLPYPADDGWKIRTLNIIKGLKQAGYSIDLLSYHNPDVDLNYEGLKKLCNNVYCVKREKSYSFLDLAKGMIWHEPFSVLNYYQDNFVEKARSISSNKYDVIQFEDIVMAQYAELFTGCYKILDMHNVESALMQRYSCGERNIFKKVYSKITGTKLWKYETSIIEQFDRILFCSNADLELLFENNNSKASVIPNGVDGSYYSPCSASEEHSNKIVFVGSMDYHANISGIEFFIDKIYENIMKAVPDVHLYIVGKNPPPSITRLGCEHITVTGSVQDTRPFISSAKVIIVPLTVGGGTRLKILEAMAMNRAVVSTSVGSEGIEVINGNHLFIEDDPMKFSEKVICLLNDKYTRDLMATRARDYILDNYEWNIITNKLSEIILESVDAKKKYHIY